MKRNIKSINTYFQTAKSQPLSLRFEEVTNLIQSPYNPIQKPINNIPTSLSQVGNLAITISSIGAIFIGSFLYNSKTELHINNRENTSSILQQNAQKFKENITSEIYSDDSKKTEYIKKVYGKKLQPKPSNSNILIIGQEAANSLSQESLKNIEVASSFNYLKVDNQTLSRLGIGIEDEGIKYHFYLNDSIKSFVSIHVKGNRNVLNSFKNTGRRFIKKIRTVTSSGDTTYYNIPVIHKYYLSFLRLEDLLSNKRNPTPIFHSDFWGKKNSFLFREERKFDHPIDFSTLIPVLVQAYNSAGDEALIWYEPTEDFLAKLSPNTAKAALALLKTRSTEEKEILDALESRVSKIKHYTKTNIALEKQSHKQNDQPSINLKINKESKALVKLPQLIIYPNPVNDWLNLNIKIPQKEKVKIYLSNLNGQVIQVLKPEGTTVNEETLLAFRINNIPAGIYVVVVQPEKGKPLTKRIIIR